jgi:hypothetical protein
MKTATRPEYPLTLDDLGIAALADDYDTSARFRLITTNGKSHDQAVRLYECADGCLFATTNGYIAWEQDLFEHLFQHDDLPQDLASIAYLIETDQLGPDAI